tara:strand:- start:128 stop:442 length:315 start_codon:yes stop_codon:yes gene_type:complete
VKNILSILLVSVLLFGCSKDRVQDTVLDSDLFGNWKNGNLNMTLSSNGNFVYYHSSDGIYDNNGIWWVEDDYLLLSGNNRTLGDDYSITDGGRLDFLGSNWDKQ